MERNHEIVGCSLASCLQTTHSPLPPPPKEETLDLSQVPPEYHDLGEVFCKSRATSLPLHRPYDCAINLKPGTTPPRRRLFLLSRPEWEAMEKYLTKAVASSLIRPSSSPAGAGFFFVGKKDGTLRPCIDYRALNDITVKNRNLLPLMNTAFELLQDTRVFTKLDLRNAYQWKTAFNTPTGHWEYLVMPFGLTNAAAVFQALVNDVSSNQSSSTLTTSSSSPAVPRNTPGTSVPFSRGCWRTDSLSKWRNVSSLVYAPHSSVSLLRQGTSVWIPRKSKESPNGPHPRTERAYNASWATLTSIAVSSEITALSPPPSVPSPLPRSSSPGMIRLRGPSPSSSPCLPRRPSLYTRTPRHSSS